MDPVYDPNAWEQKKYNDAETKELLEARLQSYPGTDPTWISSDRHNNNILHVLARTAKSSRLLGLLAYLLLITYDRLATLKERHRWMH